VTVQTWAEYAEGVKRTASQGPNQLAVCALGLCGETGEFLRAFDFAPSEAREELGDLMWYIAAVAHHTKVEFGFTFMAFQLDNGRFQIKDRLVYNAAAIAEHVKKVFGHGKVLNADKVSHHLLECLRACAAAAAALGCRLEDIAEANLEKLRARYPAGFDIQIAAAKADSAP
jgi:NTP pyrophosphatase (non-canonical NTP hydrolase)